MPRRKKVGTRAALPTEARHPFYDGALERAVGAGKRPNYDRRGRIAIGVGLAFVFFGAGLVLGRDLFEDPCRLVREAEGDGGVRLELLQCPGARQVRITAPDGYEPPPPPSPRELEAMER